MNSVEVEIFGRKYRLRSDDPQLTTSIAEAINAQIEELREKYETLDFTKLLLLISLQQQESIIRLSEKNQELSKDLDRLNQMISKIIGDI
jgi:cell division protein ZapA (FtsZ GTPase activity inhibitor)